MKLLILRHGIAMERADFAKSMGYPGKDGVPDDDLRPITGDGARKMKINAEGLAQALSRPDLILTSPLLRARQTAQVLVNAAWPKIDVRECEELRPERHPSELCDLLKALREASEADPEAQAAGKKAKRYIGPSNSIAIVGHEPHLSRTLSWFLAGNEMPFLVLRKGGACLLEFPGGLGPGAAEFRWALTPKLLRALA